MSFEELDVLRKNEKVITITTEEAIKNIKMYTDEMVYTLRDTDEHLQAEQLAIEALEKQIKVQHHHTAIKEVDGKGVYFRFSICPKCLGEIISYKNDKYPRYCNWCGQAIDWGDVE